MRAELLTRLHSPGGGPAIELITAMERAGEEIISGVARSAAGVFYFVEHGILDLLPKGRGPLTRAQRTNFFWGTAAFYEQLWRSRALTLLTGEPFGFERELPLLLDLVGPPRPGLWLDLAASTALYGRTVAGHVARVGGEVIANDIAMPMLRVAREWSLAEGRANLSLVRARAEQLPFADEQLAGAVCGGSLNEFGQAALAAALCELHRCLAPGAPAIFMHLTASPHVVGRRLQQVAAHSGLFFPRLDQTNEFFSAAGFSIERQECYNIVAFTRLAKSPSD